jgi:hypothetical protein
VARGNSSDPPHERGPFSIEADLEPVAGAYPGAPTGRVRSLAEARRALRIPTSSETDVLRLWGTPTDFQLAAYPVSDPETPDLIAEFAVLRVIKRHGRDLVAGSKHTTLSSSEKRHNLWVVYGSIIAASDKNLLIESLAFGPAFPGQLAHTEADILRGVTPQLLRLLSPPRILAACVERLHANAHRLELAAQAGTAPPISERQRAILTRTAGGRPKNAPVSNDQIAAVAKRYIELVTWGLRHPLPQLAKEFGITRTQARDRVHRARTLRYLGATTPGRAIPTLGHRLKRLNWSPPFPHPDHRQVPPPTPSTAPSSS